MPSVARSQRDAPRESVSGRSARKCSQFPGSERWTTSLPPTALTAVGDQLHRRKQREMPVPETMSLSDLIVARSDSTDGQRRLVEGIANMATSKPFCKFLSVCFDTD